jgi:hypothetical protein
VAGYLGRTSQLDRDCGVTLAGRATRSAAATPLSKRPSRLCSVPLSALTARLPLTGLVLRIALAKVARIASLNGTLQRTFVAMLLGWRFVTRWRELRGSADRHSAPSA